MLQEGVIDISYTQFTFTETRATTVDFSIPFRIDKAKLFIPKTGASPGNLNAYFKDFGMDFWISLIATLACISVIVFFLNNHEHFHKVMEEQ